MTPMELRRWPRKNDPDSIRARQEARGLTRRRGHVGRPRAVDARAASRSPASRSIPVSVVGPLRVALGEYELARRRRRRRDGRGARKTVFVPLAHTEGGLTASMQRGAKAVAESGGFRTYVLADRITRASLLRLQVGGARRSSSRAGSRASSPAMRGWLASQRRPVALALRAAARGEDARRRPDVPRALALDDRRRGRAEHDDPQRVRAEHGLRDASARP